jgi:hypothetical protein
MKKEHWGIFFSSINIVVKFTIIFLFLIIGINSNAQCTNSVSYGSATAPTNNIPLQISTCNFQTEYNTINSIVAGNTYSISNSCGGYITVRSGTFNGTVVTSGNAPLSFTAPTSGTYYFHYNTNAGCGTATNCCTTTITCTSCSAPVTPANDLCANATALPCGTTNLAGTTVLTTNIAHNTGCATMSNYGVWYTFTGDGQQTTVSTNPSFDIKLSISTGSCGAFTNIVCTDTSPESATFTTVSGTQYYVYVASYGTASTTTGTFTISRTCNVAPIPPANDLCTNATSLPCGTTNLAGTTVATSNIAHGTGCTFISNYGVWYTFTGDGQQTTVSTNPSFDIKLSIATGSCGAFTNIVCTDTSPESATFTTVLGTQYYVYVASYGNTSTTTGTFTISRTCTAPPPPLTNDDCSGAIALTVNSTCTFASYSNLGANASVGIPAPGCGSYLGGDVWFSVVVPPTGNFIVDTQAGVITDSGMAAYSGTCGALALIACDDFGGTGAMSSLNITGRTPGEVIYIRFWEYGNDNNGTFGICVTEPINPCSTITNIAACGTTINTTIAAGSGAFSNSACGWTTPGIERIYTFTPLLSGPYTLQQTSSYTTIDYHYKAVSAGCDGNNWACIDDLLGASTSSTFFLSAGVQYYFLLDPENTTGGNVSFIINCTTAPCTNGSGTGTSALACPSVLSGGLGLNGADPLPINCNSASVCVDLEASYLQLGDTSSYTVESIPYVPPYQYSCLQNPVSVNIDDVWSPVINLPFDFCFYGNTFNSCIMGSNGMISFDVTEASGQSGYAFSNNLPSLLGALFPNTIYGVYHDIDPSKGGTVGWELITLNTGCRALVASWDNIPLFSAVCNSILYTGMIVLYEDTNVIEVYIKEKNVCTTWNGGNAIVGIQNGSGTQAVVAPGRNGLDADWTVTSEAWRFVPAGPTITSIQWFEGSGTTGPMIGNTDTINVCPTATTIYTAQVTYALCNGNSIVETDETTVTVIGDKTWNGSVDTDWNKNNNWTPVGIPNNTDCVLIPVTANDPIVSGTNYIGYAGTLRILNNATLTVNSSNTIAVTDWVNVVLNGTFDIQNDASLVQINNTVNTGNIIYRRDANIRKLDYVYWSSPVAGYNVSAIPSPLVPGPIYTWDTTFGNPNGGQGYWIGATGSTMQNGIGYIMRGPNSFGNTPTLLNGSFIGVPNNGQITIPIYRGSDTDTTTHYGSNGTEITNYTDNNNLIGNPYPSAIRASQFLVNNNTKIEGNVKLWTHGTLPAAINSPFYDTYAYNYTPGDYFEFNFTGVTCCPTAASDLFIGAGQGFFVQMVDGPMSSDVISFDNGLRSSGYDNSLFYRTTNQSQNETNLTDLERHRMWLDIIDANEISCRTLVGYIEGATMDRDSYYDSNTAVTGSLLIYSLLNQEKLSTQGRSLPFDQNDIVPIGVHIPQAGTHTIALAAIDGLFETQEIYLHDKALNIIHDIKSNPYLFESQAGTYSERFDVIYQNGTLSNPNFSLENSVKVVTNEQIHVYSSLEPIESIIVYNVLGQKLKEYKEVNNNSFTLTSLQKNNTTLLLKIKLQNETISIQKAIY